MDVLLYLTENHTKFCVNRLRNLGDSYLPIDLCIQTEYIKQFCWTYLKLLDGSEDRQPDLER